MTNNSFRKNTKQYLIFKCTPNIEKLKFIQVYENFYYIASLSGYYLSIDHKDGKGFSATSPNMALTAIITSKTISKKQFLDKVKDVYLYLQFLTV